MSNYGTASGQRVRKRTEPGQPRSRRVAERAVAQTSSSQPAESLRSAFGIGRVPRATYRFQFSREFTFQQAQELVDYLKELGISDLYASPIFAAGPNSTHGYDICGYDRLNPGIGTEEEFQKLATTLQGNGMGLLVDMVPNHMGNDCSNKWWHDVLEKGTGSNFAWWFDIDWKPANPATHGKVLLPILEDHYWRVLESGKLKLVFEDERFWVRYHDRRFPLSPLASRSLKQQGAKKSIEQVVRELNGRPGEPQGDGAASAFLLRRRHYRFAFWRMSWEA